MLCLQCNTGYIPIVIYDHPVIKFGSIQISFGISKVTPLRQYYNIARKIVNKKVKFERG